MPHLKINKENIGEALSRAGSAITTHLGGKLTIVEAQKTSHQRQHIVSQLRDAKYQMEIYLSNGGAPEEKTVVQQEYDNIGGILDFYDHKYGLVTLPKVDGVRETKNPDYKARTAMNS